jgi:hypothetical protein
MYKRLFRNRISMFLVLMLSLTAANPVASGIFGVPRAGLGGTYHGQPVEPNTLRVTLSGMHRFLVAKKGDRRNKGELDEITLILSSREPIVLERFYQNFGELFFYNETRGKGPGSHPYLTIGKGDIVYVRPPRRGDEIPDSWINLPPEGRFAITLIAHESDCTKDIICKRGNKGSYMVEMTLPPLPDPMPASCGPSNTFRWGNLDFRYQVIGMRDVTIAEEGSVILYPVEGSICVTAAR